MFLYLLILSSYNKKDSFEIFCMYVLIYVYIPFKKKLVKSRTILKILGRKLEYLHVPIAMGHDKLPCPLDIVLPSVSLFIY